MALFQVKDEENGDQETKKISSFSNRIKYDRDNPSTSDGSVRLLNYKTSSSSELEISNDQNISF